MDNLALRDIVNNMNPSEESSNLVSSISIEDKIKNLFVNQNALSINEKSAIESFMKLPRLSPEALTAIQEKIGGYSLDIALFSTLTHKSVSAIETLIKSQ